VQPAADPIAVAAEQHALAASPALDDKDLEKSKAEIALLQQTKGDHPSLAALNQRLAAAETEARDKERQMTFERYMDTAQKAIDSRDIPGAKTAIGNAAAIQDNDEVANLRKALAKLETPPATPAPVAAAPTVATKSEPPEPAKSTASTKTRQPEPKRREDPQPPKRTAQAPPPAPEPRATPKPAAQTQPPPRQQPTTSAPKKVFSIPGS